MEGFNMEEYRQSWETGEHWELKREFIEKYKDNFSVDRLLCLAQAYSNIELLHCSYPDQVMQEVFELSKPLKACKVFRERVKTSKSDEKSAVKRERENAVDTKPMKLIKFCSASNSTEFNKGVIKTEKISVSSPSFTEPVQSGQVCSADKQRTENSVQELASKLKIKETVLKRFHEIAQEIKNQIVKDPLPVKAIYNACQKTNSHVDFRITDVSSSLSSSMFKCEFLLENIIICTATDTSKKKAKSSAAKDGMAILLDSTCLYSKLSENNPDSFKKNASNNESLTDNNKIKDETSNMNEVKDELNNFTERCISAKYVLYAFNNTNDVKYDPSVITDANLKLIHSFSEKVKENRQLPPYDAIVKASSSLGNENLLHFDVFTRNKSNNFFFCKIILNDILLSHGTGRSKDIARQTTAKSAVKLLSQLPENLIVKEFKPVPKNQIVKTFRSCINRDLLRASYEKQFVLLDNSENIPENQRTPGSLLQHSASFCHRILSFEYATCGNSSFKVDVVLDGIIVGSATSVIKMDAKRSAAYAAVENLQKSVYTIKVKDEHAESFQVQRDQLFDWEMKSGAIADNNIGCKLLKGMGWTGGGIGKNSGIIEPITAGTHSFGQGLGFGNHKKTSALFKRKVNALLQEFKKSNSFSDLIFCADFSKLERKDIHKIAHQYNLSSNSIGVDDARHLIIRNKYTVLELLDHLVQVGGSTTKYELIDLSRV